MYNSSIKLLLIGPIEKRNCISKYSIDQIQTNTNIIFTDFVSDASNYYSIMNLFILPSYREGFPTVNLEASSMCLPILTTKYTGCVESILENFTGMYINNDPLDIASKIIFYYNNKSIRIKHGNNGRKFVVEKYDQYLIWELIDKNLNLG
jgi:glycosyltransferase involved in cell wall biosynthesis